MQERESRLFSPPGQAVTLAARVGSRWAVRHQPLLVRSCSPPAAVTDKVQVLPPPLAQSVVTTGRMPSPPVVVVVGGPSVRQSLAATAADPVLATEAL